jgi:hypothetical protein
MVGNQTQEIKIAAAEYVRRGWAPIPIPHRAKNPKRTGWQNLRLTEEDLPRHFNGRPQNIGVLLGEPSGWLVDVDLDHPGAVEAADKHLPATGAVFGRPGNPRSHRLYRVTGAVDTMRLHLSSDRAVTVVELRSTGCQTVFPPSMHPSGEQIAWHEDGEPSLVDPDELVMAVHALHAEVDLRHRVGTPKPASNIKTDNTCTPPPTPAAKPSQASVAPEDLDKNTPWGQYNREKKKNTRLVLLRAGWMETHSDKENEYWRRPGKSDGHSATLNNNGVFYVFSSSAAPFEADTAYTPFQVLALLEHNGDFKAAGKVLQDNGYGKKRAGRKHSPGTKAGGENYISNGEHFEGEDGKKQFSAFRMQEILGDIRAKTGDWPRRVGNSLFVHDEHGISFLPSTQAFFGWLHRHSRVVWFNSASAVKQSELFSELSRTSRKYIAVEDFPHEPPMQDHFYACKSIPPGDGKKLRWLIDRFCPATELDRQLILSAFLTPLWGGPCGCRPCYVITSDDGRGAGKTTVAESVGSVFGGTLQFSHLEDIGTIKTRLLSPDALSKRVCLLDNVKSHKFSWAELEATITAGAIGGHRLFVGEATRPNSLSWFVTLNGACLSTDMAQRSIVVKIRRPERSASWAEETREFINDHRQEIIGDLIGVLRGPQTELAKFTRWASWERDVLQRLPEPSALQQVILERQAATDVDGEESEILQDFFAEQLQRLEYDPDAERVFIPSQVAARWLGWATNQPKITVVSASRQLKQLIAEGRLSRLEIPGRSWGRGVCWVGERWNLTHTSTDLEERLRAKSNTTF